MIVNAELGKSHVFEWSKTFKEGMEDVGDDLYTSTSKTDDNVHIVPRIAQEDYHLSIRAISEMLNLDKETVRQVLHDNLGMRKMCANINQNSSLNKESTDEQISSIFEGY